MLQHASSELNVLAFPIDLLSLISQRYFGAAVGKGRQSAKTSLERLKLEELTCADGVKEIAKMCAPDQHAQHGAATH